MKLLLSKRTLPLIAALCMFLTLILSPVYHAAAAESGQIQHIYDNAGLLSTSELNDLEEMCTKYSKADQAEFIILTNNDSKASDGEVYIENFYDKTPPGDSAVVLLVDMYNRDVVVEAYGSLQSKINSERADAIAEKMSSSLT